ncbi:MAG: HDOD domain-containing protein [Deltaproteobacteria bacterium]|nr:HDOD domain-containing protein [Deltaproteobacteria bacterium]
MKQEESLIEIADEFISSDKTVLLPFDRNTLRIQQEIGKEDPDTRLIEKLIASDPALTSQVLRLANSAFYKGLTKVSTVHNAMVRIGITEIANIVTLVTHGKNFQSKDAVVREILGKLWTHSVGCAIGSQWLAMKRGLRDLCHEAFIAGLLHDVGKLFLITTIDAIRTSGRIASRPSLELLSELMETMHTKYGHALLKSWNLPEVYCEIALKHHEEECGDDNILLLLVRLGNYACKKMGIGLHNDPTLLLAATPEAHSLGLSELVLAELEIKLEDSLNLAI